MENCDVVVEIDGVSFYCAKEELIKESSYFEAMFKSDFVEKNKNHIELKDVEMKHFLTILEILRRETFVANCTDINKLIGIFITANMLLFTKIQEECITALNWEMCVDNVLEIWQLAERFNIEAINVKARFLAVTEFEKIRKTDSFLNLDLTWIFKYLANRHLLLDHEMNVFEAGMRWLAKNDEEAVDKEKIIYTLFTCLDFNKLSVFNIMEIQNHVTLQNYRNLIQVLKCIVDIRNKNSANKYTDDVVNKAKLLLGSKQRLEGRYPTFAFHYTADDEQDEIVNRLAIADELLNTRSAILYYYDGHDFKLFIEPDHYLESMFYPGVVVFSYKDLILQLHCTGRFFENIEVQVYDVLTDKAFTKLIMNCGLSRPEVITCGRIAYIINSCRLPHDPMFLYDCETNECSTAISFPENTSEPFLHCNYKQQLFIMFGIDAPLPRGYFFNRNERAWSKVIVFSDNNGLGEDGKAIMVCYNNIFVKGKFLTEFEVSVDGLVQISRQEINPPEGAKTIENYCICEDTVYTLYSCGAENQDLLEIFSLTTRTATSFPIIADRMFSSRHYNACEKEDFVNDYFKNCS